jgi:peptidoglycan hydrolase-like protein with peptidoglycan-binding domain
VSRTERINTFRQEETLTPMTHRHARFEEEMLDGEPRTCPAHGTEYVRWVQSALNQVRALRLPLSGTMDAPTRSALRSFQRAKALPPDGIAGPDSDQALRAALSEAEAEPEAEFGLEEGEAYAFETLDLEWAASMPTLRRGSSGSAVSDLQRRLSAAGFDSGAVDGIFGSLTDAAVRAFQGARRLGVDGIVGPNTWGALLGAAPGVPSVPATPAAGAPNIVNVRGIYVASEIAAQVEALLGAARADGVPLTGSGYRSPTEQIATRKKNCGPTHYDIYDKPSSECSPPTAKPGTSMHERGLAIDFKYGVNMAEQFKDTPGFVWLQRNASRFGLKNFAKEPWHWSTTGT